MGVQDFPINIWSRNIWDPQEQVHLWVNGPMYEGIFPILRTNDLCTHGLPRCSHMHQSFGVPKYSHFYNWLTVFNRKPHSGSGASQVLSWKAYFRTTSKFPTPFQTWKGQWHFSNDQNRFRKVLAPFRTRNRQKHFNCLTISYVHLNLWLPFVTAPITIHYKLHSDPSGGLIQFILLTSTSVVFIHLRQRIFQLYNSAHPHM